MSEKPTVRCAIYTRKSSEEGLDLAFNSLEAQREACAAYVASQKHEGWKLSGQHYDDGGHSGGTLERPALQKLLRDIDAGRVGMVVVYKIDRLTRSLADFAKLVERLDAARCSFVSVTQSFNTSSSMGRPTLNVLLSFAQFEREVTAERIRDKIAASKKRGMWMGGMVPLGYDRHPDPKQQTLEVNENEAEAVQTIYRLYDEHECLRTVQAKVTEAGIRSKQRKFQGGQRRGGGTLSRGQIQFLLANPIYTGKVRHKLETHKGLHPPIVDNALWDRVQSKLQSHSALPRIRDRQTGKLTEPKFGSPLAGRIFDETGDRLTPSHAVSRGRRHRYYVSNRLVKESGKQDPTGWRLPARELEAAIAAIVAQHLGRASEAGELLATTEVASALKVQDGLKTLVSQLSGEPPLLLNEILHRCTVAPGRLNLQLNGEHLARALGVSPQALSSACLTFDAPFQLRHRGVEAKIVAGQRTPSPDPTLTRTLAAAHRWLRLIKSGRSITEVAAADGHSPSFVRVRIGLAFLSPRIQTSILDGTQPGDLNLEKLVRSGIPLDWAAQEHRFGFAD